MLMPLRSFQNLKFISVYKDEKDITKNESQEVENQVVIYNIRTDIEGKIPNREEYDHEIREKDKDILYTEFKAMYSINQKAEFELNKKLSSDSVIYKQD